MNVSTIGSRHSDKKGFAVGLFVGILLGLVVRRRGVGRMKREGERGNVEVEVETERVFLQNGINQSSCVKHENDDKEQDAQSGQEFISAGSYLLKWIVQYRSQTVHDLPVISKMEPNYLVNALPTQAPVLPESWVAIFSDLSKLIVPGLTNWESSSKFFAYFKPHSSYPAVLGEMLCAGLNVMGFDWIASPACTELEVATLDWLARFLNLPEKFLNIHPGPGGSVIQGSAGEAAIVALLAALVEKQKQWKEEKEKKTKTKEETLSGEPLQLLTRENMVVFSSDQAHAIIQKACIVLGVGHHRVISTSEKYNFAMQAEDLRKAIEEEIALGRIPVMVVATTGTTSSCAFDPLRDIGQVTLDYQLWLHIDAAYGGAYACLPELAHLFDGLELAQSFVVNCHKKLLCPFDLAAMYVADRRPLLNALSLQPEYLRNAASESGAVVDYEHWQLPLGRRFRSLKLWFVFRRFGQQKMRDHLQRSLHLSAYFECLLLNSQHQPLHLQHQQQVLFELTAPRSLSLVCFRLKNRPEEDQQRLLDNIKASGECFIIHTKLAGHITLRLACGGLEQTEKDILGAYNVIYREALKIVNETSPM